MNLNSNILLKRVGEFCNFADGLVSKKVSVGLGTGGFNGLDINIRASAYSRSLIAGTTITGTTASRTLTVAGPGVGLAAGAVLLLTSGINQFFAPVYEYVMVESFAAPNLVLYDYPKYNYVAFPLYLLNFIAESYFYHAIDINELNYMYEADNYFTPNQFSTAAATDIVIFGQAIPNGTVEYFTKSIDTSYLNDIALFDMLAEIEFTKSSQIITTP
jgi:hypothetical protein